jgi:hypothetical protein
MELRTQATAGSNGHLTFGTAYNGFSITCSPFGNTVATDATGPYWGDQCTAACSGTPCTGCGIFTTTTGTAPNRIFYIEWRTNYYGQSGNQTQALLNYEVALYESGTPAFQFIYGSITPATIANDSQLVVGVKNTNTNFTQFGCDTTGGQSPPVTSGQVLTANLVGCGTPTPTPTPTATATPKCAPGWSAGPDMPTVLVRALAFSSDGNLHHGRMPADTAGLILHVLRYTPSTNSWSQMGVTLPDNQMNNMACGVLTLSGTPYIYCVGGSAAGQTTATARVFFYDPLADTITSLTASDNWPGDAAGTILPGGFAVTGNKLYILGGFNINVASTNEIWQFDPTLAVGSKVATE